MAASTGKWHVMPFWHLPMCICQMCNPWCVCEGQYLCQAVTATCHRLIAEPTHLSTVNNVWCAPAKHIERARQVLARKTRRLHDTSSTCTVGTLYMLSDQPLDCSFGSRHCDVIKIVSLPTSPVDQTSMYTMIGVLHCCQWSVLILTPF